MNWTGGDLQRHSNKTKKSNSLVNKQKQHFAKARARLQKGPTPEPPSFMPSFINIEAEHSQRRQETSSSMPPSRQKRLEEYEAVAPVVQRLSSLVTGKITPKTTSSNRNAKSKKPRNEFESSRPSTSWGQSEYDNHGLPSSENTFRQRLYIPQNSKAKDSSLPDTGQPTPTTSKESQLDQKRHELLEQRDWVGLQRSRPLRVKYPAENDREMIGKRRKLELEDVLRKQGVDSRMRVPSIHKGTLTRREPDPAVEDMSIRIGDDVRWSESPRGPERQDSRVSSQTISSEPMLLDEEFEQEIKDDEFRLLPDPDEAPEGDESMSPLPQLSMPQIKVFDSGSRSWQKAIEPTKIPQTKPYTTPQEAQQLLDLTGSKNPRRMGLNLSQNIQNHEKPYKMPSKSFSKTTANPSRLVFTSPPNKIQHDNQSSALAEHGSEVRKNNPAQNAKQHESEITASTEDDALMWEQFIDFHQELTSYACKKDSPVEESQALKDKTPEGPGPVERIENAGDIPPVLKTSHRGLPVLSPSQNLHNSPTRDAANQQVKSSAKAVDELWKSFVFGGDDSSRTSSRESVGGTTTLQQTQTSNTSLAAHAPKTVRSIGKDENSSLLGVASSSNSTKSSRPDAAIKSFRSETALARSTLRDNSRGLSRSIAATKGSASVYKGTPSTSPSNSGY